MLDCVRGSVLGSSIAAYESGRQCFLGDVSWLAAMGDVTGTGC